MAGMDEKLADQALIDSEIDTRPNWVAATFTPSSNARPVSIADPVVASDEARVGGSSINLWLARHRVSLSALSLGTVAAPGSA